ncbi:hypothetical protein P7C73_g5562, partial [Tremellales sp. Uapishka_1]
MTIAAQLNPAELTLVPATPEQAVQVRTNTIEWAEQDAETIVDENGVQHKRMVVWYVGGKGPQLTSRLLVPRSTILSTDPVTSSASPAEIYSHFETYRVPALLSEAETDEARNVTAYSVGTVWTPPEHRRKGYARLALQLGHYVMAKPEYLPPFPNSWGAPPPIVLGDGAASTLYSDVGPKYYQSCTIGEDRDGWKEQGSVIHEWEAGEQVTDVPGWEWITSFERLRALEGLAQAETRRKLAKKGRTRIALLATGSSLTAHHNRSLLRLPFPDTALPARPTALAAYNSETQSLLVFCPSNGAVIYPPFENKGKTLEISRVIGDVPWEVVLQASRREGCVRVESWGPDAGMEHWPRGRIVERGDLYSMMAFYPPLQPGEKEPLWEENGLWVPYRTWNFEQVLRKRPYAGVFA